MDSQKRENLLNMALDATPRERMESAALGTGYDFEERTWELIVRYSGDLTPLKEMGVQVKELLGGYAVLKAPEGLVDEITRLPQILYMEKPKLLYFAVNMGRSASCLSQVQSGPSPSSSLLAAYKTPSAPLATDNRSKSTAAAFRVVMALRSSASMSTNHRPSRSDRAAVSMASASGVSTEPPTFTSYTVTFEALS